MTTNVRRAASTSGLAAAGLIGLTALAGCASDGPARPLTGDAFTQNRPAAYVGNPVDKPGPLLYDTAHVPVQPPEQRPSEPVPNVGSTVQDAVRTPAAQVGQPPAALCAAPPVGVAAPAPAVAPGPAPGPAAPAGGPKWVNIGAVLMEVNGRPIFTDKVLNALEIPLASEAKKRNEASFRELAGALVDNQVNLYKQEELEFASAQRSLDPQDELLARHLTTIWRQKKITEAGGVLEVAKRRAAEQGWDFDDLVEQQYRLHLVQIFYQKRVFPLIQVAAADIRAEYNRLKDKEFTKHGSAKFRVIKVDRRKYGSPQEAYDKAVDVRKRAAAGADFAELASKAETNDDPRLVRTGGYVVPDGWVAEGAYAVEAVDKAVFKMKPGDVSDLIQTDGAYYVVKVEDVKPGGVQPFEDLAVQQAIRKKLEADQFQELRRKHVAELEKNAITRRNDAMIREALEMVMRRYPQWASAK